MNRKGILYGVGVGPGDPGLVTLRAAEIIRACPVLAAPVSGSGRILAWEIASRAVPEAAGKELLRLDFPMLRDREALDRSHDRVAAQVMEVLDSGRDVAMLNLGDPSIYATYSYLQSRVLAAGGYEVVTIPGVPSFCAVAARLNQSLTKAHLPFHVVPAGYPGLARALEAPGAKVVMNAGKEAREVRQLLETLPGNHTARMVRDCGLPTERVWEDLAQAEEDAGYFATILVKEED